MTFSKLIQMLSADNEVPKGTRLPDVQVRVRSAEGSVPRRPEVGGKLRVSDMQDLSVELERPAEAV